MNYSTVVIMWFSVLFLALFVAPGVKSDGPRYNNNFGGPSNGAQAFAGSGPSNGAQSFAGSGDYYYGDESFSDARSGPSNGAQAFADSGPSNGAQSFAGSGPSNGAQPFRDSGPSNGAQSFASSGQSNGAQPFGRPGPNRSPNQQPRDNGKPVIPANGKPAIPANGKPANPANGKPANPTKVVPTSPPIIATTPNGGGTTAYPKNPIGDASTSILNCALDSVGRMANGTVGGLKEVVQIFLTNPPQVALMKVLGTSINNLSEGDLKAIKGSISNSMKDMYGVLKTSGSIL